MSHPDPTKEYHDPLPSEMKPKSRTEKFKNLEKVANSFFIKPEKNFVNVVKLNMLIHNTPLEEAEKELMALIRSRTECSYCKSYAGQLFRHPKKWACGYCHDKFYSQIQDRVLEENEIVNYCAGCETPMTEEDRESEETLYTDSGDTYCHLDCYKDQY